ncbi:MAG: hypothetical protein AAGI08_03975 [Bacteroidota bacterium]
MNRIARWAAGEQPDGARLLEWTVVAWCAWFAGQWAVQIAPAAVLTEPAGLAQYVDLALFTRGAWPMLWAGVAWAGLALGVFRKGRWSYAVAVVALHVLYVARFSFGKLPHGSNLTATILVGLAVAAVAFREETERRRFVMAYAFVFVGLGYGLAAVSKLVGTGWTWPDGQHLWLWIHEKGIDRLSRDGAWTPSLLQGLVLDSRLAGTLMLSIGWLSEWIAFLLPVRRLRLPILLLLAALHLGVYPILGISFLPNLCVLGVLVLSRVKWRAGAPQKV